MSPLPRIDCKLIVFIFTPDIKVSCLTDKSWSPVFIPDKLEADKHL
jgi:hypothetical protein